MKSPAFFRRAALLAAAFFFGAPPVAAQFVITIILVPVEAETEESEAELLRNSIRFALDGDPRVPSEQIAIVIRNGVEVILIGTLGDEDSKQAALERVRRTPGVRNVRDKLKVNLESAPVRHEEKRMRVSRPGGKPLPA